MDDASTPAPDAFVREDAFTPTMPDTGPELQGYLDDCTSDAQCEPELHCATDFPRAFCTRTCVSDAICGSGAYCVDGRCVPSCRSGRRECDVLGGSCTIADVAFCAPACGATGISTTRCSGGLTCDAYRGECTTMPVTGGRDIGDPCEDGADCRTGICIGAEWGYVGGLCVGQTRSAGVSSILERGGCPPGSVMGYGVPAGDSVACMPECTRQSDCRAGYYCGAPPDSPIGYCNPIDCDVPGVPACPTGTMCQAFDDGRRRCATCTPECTGRTCGPDGCGGTCGTCATGTICTSDGLCACSPETDVALCAAASADCGSITATDRCGVTRTPSCGACTPPASCGAITPNRCDCVAETDAELCSARGASCGTISVTDRCGAVRTPSCGTCMLPATCGGAGVPNTCGVCTPSCTGRVCGSDGCGGTCGGCGSGERCTAFGTCEPIPCDPVMSTLCSTGQKCEWTGSATMCVAAGTGVGGDPCWSTSECAAQHTCTGEGFCREYCTSHSHCGSGRCAFSLSGSSYRLCSRPCDPVPGSGPDGCNSGEACRLLNTSYATEVTDCGDYGTAYTGDPCTATADCFPGNTCVGGSCRRVCRLGTTCLSGTCAAVSGWVTYGVCPP